MPEISKKTVRGPIIFIIGLLCLSILPFPGVTAAGNAADDIPFPARVTIYKAQQHLQKNAATKAIAVLQAFRNKGSSTSATGTADPKGYFHYLIDFNLGNAYLMLNRPSEAIPHFRTAVKKQPLFTEGWQNLAKCHYDTQQYLKAGQYFLKAYETAEKKQAEVLYYSAVSFMSGNQNKKSTALFERLFAAHGDQIRTEWKENYVHACLAADKNAKALPFLEALTRETKGEKRKKWQEVLLYQYVTLNMKTRAARYAKQLTRNFPLEPKWWKALVHIHLLDNRYKDALIDLTVYSFLKPLNTQETRLMADLNATLNIPVQAARFYEKLAAKRLDPGVLKRLVYAFIQLQDSQQALQTVEKGLKLKSADAIDFWMLKGRILYEMEQYAEAAEAFTIATHKKPKMGKAWMMLGYAALNMDDQTKARQAFSKAAEIPEFRKTARALLVTLDKQAASAYP